MFKEYRAIEVSQKPTKLLQTLFGSLAAASRALGVSDQAVYTWNRNKRIPLRVWQQMMQAPQADRIKDAVVNETPITLTHPYRLGTTTRSSTRGRKTPATHAKESAKESVSASTTASPDRRPTPTKSSAESTLGAMVTRLEQENAALRRTLAAVWDAVRDVTRKT